MTRLALITLAAFTLGGCSILDIPSTTPTGRSFFDIPQTTPTGRTFFDVLVEPIYATNAIVPEPAPEPAPRKPSTVQPFSGPPTRWLTAEDIEELERLRRERRIDDMLDAFEHQQWIDDMNKHGLWFLFGK